MKKARMLAISVLALLCPAWAAMAQTKASAAEPASAGHRLFVDAAIRADYDRTLNPVSTTIAAGFAAGFAFNDRYSFRFEADVPGRHVAEYISSSDGTGYVFREGQRTRSHSLLLARHLNGDGPIHVALLVGISLMFRDQQDLLTETSASTRVVNETNWTGFMAPAPTGGVDVAVDIGRHVWLVPEMRVHLAQRIDFVSIIARPSLALRWRF
jgi:hypothetical protein